MTGVCTLGLPVPLKKQVMPETQLGIAAAAATIRKTREIMYVAGIPSERRLILSAIKGIAVVIISAKADIALVTVPINARSFLFFMKP